LHREVISALVRARKEAGLTQRDLAGRIGKPPSFVGKVEAIERNLSLLEFIEWTRALGVNAQGLLERLNH
jgi:transcriptional regulator with XRE-family HTH domain